MRRSRMVAAALAAAGIAALTCAGAWTLRRPLSLLFPIEHTGTLMRVAQFHKGGYSGRAEGTRQLRQIVLIFEDGFDCEGTDSSLAAVREGDLITIRGYHDVRGTPFLDPEWWECDEAQLVRLHPPGKALPP